MKAKQCLLTFIIMVGITPPVFSELIIDSIFPETGMIGKDLVVQINGRGFDENTQALLFSGDENKVYGLIPISSGTFNVIVMGNIVYVMNAFLAKQQNAYQIVEPVPSVLNIPPGYSFISIPFHINICSFNLDIDGDGVISSLTDGMLILRYLLNLSSGDSLIKDAISMNATRTTDIEIQQFINRGLNYLDIDGNSTIDALSDGLLIFRYLDDLKPDVGLINKAIGKNVQHD
jgi:hypothetical protein